MYDPTSVDIVNALMHAGLDLIRAMAIVEANYLKMGDEATGLEALNLALKSQELGYVVIVSDREIMATSDQESSSIYR